MRRNFSSTSGPSAAEVIPAVVADRAVAVRSNAEAADRVFVHPPPEWEGQRCRLPALAGLAWWLAPSIRPAPERPERHEQQRKRGRLANTWAGAG
jgi:hypothetical protein